ncbi:MAG: SurA N-terminal domain-containing protein [Oligoflexus sp.]|nr:SurA N-terminal domain-containing protein [Oligoflexus sp.]
MFKWRKTADLDAKSVANNWITYVILGTVIITMAFFGVCSPRNGGESGFMLPSGTAAKVDGEKIGSLEFRRSYIQYSSQLEKQYKDKFDAVALGVAPQVLNGLVQKLAIYKEANKNGIAATEDEVTKVIIDGKYFNGENGKFDPKLFEMYLRNNGHTEASFTEDLRRDIVNQKFRSFIAETSRASSKIAELNYLLDESKIDVEYLRLDPNSFPVTIAPADVDKFLAGADAKKAQEYYDQNKTEFNKEAQVKARHILISFKGSRSASAEGAARSKEDAKALATKIAGEVKKPGADFAALASKYTDEASGKAKGGDLGFFKKEQMVKEFADVAFAMKAGQISNPVESPFGYHIIRVDTVQEAKATTFEEAKRGIAEKLIAKERRPQLMTEKLKTIVADLKAGKDDSAALGLSWKTTGPFAVGARFIPGIGPDKEALKAVATLKTPGQLHADALDISGVKYIVRLKSRQEADLKNLTPEKRDELVESSKYMEGYSLYNTIGEEIAKRYDREGKIYKNPEFLAYDKTLHGNKSSGGSAPVDDGE